MIFSFRRLPYICRINSVLMLSPTGLFLQNRLKTDCHLVLSGELDPCHIKVSQSGRKQSNVTTYCPRLRKPSQYFQCYLSIWECWIKVRNCHVCVLNKYHSIYSKRGFHHVTHCLLTSWVVSEWQNKSQIWWFLLYIRPQFR